MIGERLHGREFDLCELEMLGRVLDRKPVALQGRSTGVFLAENLLKVRGKDGRLYPLKANAVQREFERRRRAGNIVLKARQMGLTTWVAGRFLLKTITRPGTLTLLVAHTQESAEEILRIVHRFVEHLPEGLRAGALKTSRSSARQIVFPAIDSEFRVESAADRNAGRGLTVQNLHCSEVARWPGNAGEILAGLRAGLAAEGDSELVLESTPYGTAGCFYEEWRQAGLEAGLASSARLIRHFFPWWMEPGYRATAVDAASLSEEERALVTRAGRLGSGADAALTLEQIGFRRQMRAAQGGLARQEFAEDAESCFRVSGEPYFDMEALELRLRELSGGSDGLSGRDGVSIFRKGVTVWLEPVAGRRYVVAVDPAGGGSEGDFSAIEVLDVETGMQCAEFAGHESGLALARRVAELGRWYGDAWLVVERNNHGSGVLLLLEEQLDCRRVFRAGDGQAGLLTTAVSRPRMLARLAAALVESAGLFQSVRLLVECRSFVRLANGGVGARSGAHDDLVMAMAIALAGREEVLARRL